jgi:hypothetical protein
MFKMIVAGADTFEVTRTSIISVGFSTDIPMDSDARTADVGSTLTIKGRILTALDGDPFDSTRQMALWSTIPASNMACYRHVTIQNVRGSIVERKYVFPNAFVVDYIEEFGDTEGVGTFTLKIKQKKDRLEYVVVEGGYASEE